MIPTPQDYTAGSPPHLPHSPYSSPLIRRTSSDLYQCIEEHRRISEDVARYIFAQMVEIVQSLLDHGIVHCDLKVGAARTKYVESGLILGLLQDQNFCIDHFWKVCVIVSEFLRGRVAHLSFRSQVKLIDFGSAVIFDPETSRPPLLKGEPIPVSRRRAPLTPSDSQVSSEPAGSPHPRSSRASGTTR